MKKGLFTLFYLCYSHKVTTYLSSFTPARRHRVEIDQEG